MKAEVNTREASLRQTTPFDVPPRFMRQLCATPRVFTHDSFVTQDEITYIINVANDPDWLAPRGITPKQDGTGLSFEMPISGDPLMETLQARLFDVTRLYNRQAKSFRFRRYSIGDCHPPHTDTYQINGCRLTATALICLEDVEQGGETYFEKAQPDALLVPQKRGRLIYWYNVLPDGRTDELSYHEGRKLIAGSKTTLTSFVYV